MFLGRVIVLKKISRLFLFAAAAVLLLTGCGRQNTTVTVTPSGKVRLENSLLGTEEYMDANYPNYDASAEKIKSNFEYLGVESNTTVDKISETVGDAELKGIKLTSTFDNVSQMLLFYRDFFNENSDNLDVFTLTRLTSGEVPEDQSGIQMSQVDHWYGTDYYANGRLLLDAESIDANEAVKGTSDKAAVSTTFKFPFASVSKKDGGKKSLAHKFTYTADAQNPDVSVNLHVFVLNFALLLKLLLVLAFLICILLLFKKLNKLSKKLDEIESSVKGRKRGSKKTKKNTAKESEPNKTIAEDAKEAAEDLINHDAPSAEENENTGSGDKE